MSQDNIVYTTFTQLIGDEHEALLFNNHIEIENWMRNFDESDSTLDHLRLNKKDTRDLRTFLNSAEVVHFLEQ